MGFLDTVSSFMGGVVSSAASIISTVVSTGWQKTKEIAGRAVGWFAEKAEGFVGSVKKIWEVVSPHVEKARAILKMAAGSVALPFPWLSAALLGIDQAIGALTDFSKSPVAKQIDQAIRGAIQLAKRLKGQNEQKNQEGFEIHLSGQELQRAEENQQYFRQAEEELPEEHRHAMELAGLINDYAIVKTKIDDLLKTNEIQDFEHYLRLRATQKLLSKVEDQLLNAESMDEITSDDVFIMRTAADLIKSAPELSDKDALRLDALLEKRYKKKLTPFVFEEMAVAWSARLVTLQDEWALQNKALSRDTMLLRQLKTAKNIAADGLLSIDEEKMMVELECKVPEAKKELDASAKSQREMRNYVYAAEGFIQVLEKTPEELIAEGREFLAEEGASVGQLIIECAQHGRNWDSLTEDQQSLIIDFANIFEKESKYRAEQLLEMAA